MGDFCGGGIMLIVSILLMVFLTDSAGLTPLEAASIPTIVKFWSAFFNPVMGYITDNTRSRFGRRRIYFVFGAIPLGIIFAMLWVHIPEGSSFKYWYYLLTFASLNTMYSVMMVPYNTLAAEMTKDYSERSKMGGFRMFFSQSASLLGSIAPGYIMKYAQGDAGYLAVGIFFGIIFALVWIFVYLGTWEDEEAANSPRSTTKLSQQLLNLLKEYSTTFKNRSFVLHLFMYLAPFMAMDVFNGLFFYFVNYCLNESKLFASNSLGYITLIQVCFLPFIAWLLVRVDIRKPFVISLTIWAIGIGLLSLVPANPSWLLIIIVGFIIGCGHVGSILIPWTILPFMSDVDELITARRREGIYAGCMSFTRQLSMALSLLIIGIILNKIGYVANQVQSPQTIADFRIALVLVPGALIVIGIFAGLLFKINKQTHGIFMQEIQRLKNGGSPLDVTQNTREVCQQLTGVNYEKCILVTK